MARLMLSAGMLAARADSVAAFRRRLPLGSPPPFLAATVISRRILEKRSRRPERVKSPRRQSPRGEETGRRGHARGPRTKRRKGATAREQRKRLSHDGREIAES